MATISSYSPSAQAAFHANQVAVLQSFLRRKVLDGGGGLRILEFLSEHEDLTKEILAARSLYSSSPKALDFLGFLALYVASVSANTNREAMLSQVRLHIESLARIQEYLTSYLAGEITLQEAMAAEKLAAYMMDKAEPQELSRDKQKIQEAYAAGLFRSSIVTNFIG